jgi:hypothetical protein
MDVRTLESGVTLDDAIRAHRKDLRGQDACGVRYLRYRFDEVRGRMFCLGEAPSAAVTIAVHRQAHCLVADEVFQV